MLASVNSYSDDAKRLLKLLWKAMSYMGAVRMKAAIPHWIENWIHEDMDDLIRHELKSMSVSTIERTLKEKKAILRRKRNTATRRSDSKPKTEIPIRDLETQPTEVGHCEIDCVAHCGGSLSGSHAWSLNVTDIVSGFTVTQSMQAKTGLEVKKALYVIENMLPFSIIALYMDNGSEFLNENMTDKFSKHRNKITREEYIGLFRSRPYQKNDQCFVEQKNFTHIRELFGYDRHEGKLHVQLMNAVYRNEWFILTNFFFPQIRLKSKERIGSKVVKKFHPPRTPFEILKDHLPPEKLETLQQHANQNPFYLLKKLRRKLREFQGYKSKKGEALGKYDL